MLKPLAEYCRSISTKRNTGQATEHSYRSALESLITAVGGNDIEAINEPRQAEYGAPDFIVQRSQVPIGHVECKDVGTSLDTTQENPQLQRYREALPNLILTDYLEFRWYVNGELRAEARIGRFDATGSLIPEAGGDDAVLQVLDDFVDAEVPIVGQSADLARRMASKTRLLRRVIEQVITGDADNTSSLSNLLTNYRKVLINDLSVGDFADLQAQTAAYGLFAARCLHSGPADAFNRESAVSAVKTPFLRDVLGLIAGYKADSRIVWIIDDLALLLARADMAAVMEDFGKATRQVDPIVHFYEDFLSEYDPYLRELRGVYYTPEPVVKYIVRSVDWVLRNKFELADGLAHRDMVKVKTKDGMTQTFPRVLVLDPAAGTGTFLSEVISHIRDDLAKQGLGGTWSSYVPKHLLPRLFGFELLMAAYTVCHLKLALEISGDSEQYTLPDGERLGIFLTNSLTEAHEDAGGPMFEHEIAREAREADAIKRDHPVMVIIGNPPYSGHSANKGKWIGDLLRGRVADDPHSYFSIDGKPLNERNPKWLNDDYVKFIRFAQWRINQTGEGVLGFVTNHSYLDNPTFRGMRESLLETFDEIWLLDLHGNSKRRERSPDGSPDQNVFDIQQGVAIGIFVKTPGGSESFATVQHADLWGHRGDAKTGKYAWLAKHDIASTPWHQLEPQAPDYFFVPRDYTLLAEYEAGWKLTDIAPVNSVGIVTARDKIAIQWSDEEMRRVATDFAALPEETARQNYNLGRDSDDWQVAAAQKDLQKHTDAEQHIKPILYRPFDARATYYTGTAGGFICRPRYDVMRHMLDGSNLALITTRQTRDPFDVFASRSAIGHKSLAAFDINYLFPLYVYPLDDSALQLGLDTSMRSPNLAKAYVEALEESSDLAFIPDGHGDLKSTFGPEDAFHYIYAMLRSSQFRQRYAEFLKSDFPRVPLPSNGTQFSDLVRLGAQLTSLHTMLSQGKDLPAFNVAGSDRIDGLRYGEPSKANPGRVWINRDQHFEGVAPQTWRFTIGGYQPAKKWLQDRKGRVLDFDDIQAYRHICAALAETPRIMQEIDDTIEAHGGWPLTPDEANGD